MALPQLLESIEAELSNEKLEAGDVRHLCRRAELIRWLSASSRTTKPAGMRAGRRVCSGGLGLTPAGAIVPSCLADTLNGSAPLAIAWMPRMIASASRIGPDPGRSSLATAPDGASSSTVARIKRRADQSSRNMTSSLSYDGVLIAAGRFAAVPSISRVSSPEYSSSAIFSRTSRGDRQSNIAISSIGSSALMLSARSKRSASGHSVPCLDRPDRRQFQTGSCSSSCGVVSSIVNVKRVGTFAQMREQSERRPECDSDPRSSQRLIENEMSDFSRLWHDGCGETIIWAQNVDPNHSAEV